MNEIEVKVTANRSRKYFIMYWRDPVSDVREERSTKKTKRRDALRVAARWEAELRSGKYSKQSRRVTWEQFRDTYFEDKLAGSPRRTQESVATAFNHLEQSINPKMLSSLTSATVSRFKRELRNVGVADTSVAAYMRALRSALNWAAKRKLLAEAPEFDIPKRGKGRRLMRGRPITTEEYERMVVVTPHVRPLDASAWQWYLTGLWLFGLRLEESVALSWDDDAEIAVDLTGRYPRLRIYSEAEKGNRDRLLPMTPDFAEFLLATPEAEQHGLVFRLVGLKTKQSIQANSVGRVVSDIGRCAGVVIDKAKDQHATAHDFRRAFGTRWSTRVKPARLQILMRHQSIETTLKYYVAEDADDVAADLWRDFKPVGTTLFSGGLQGNAKDASANAERT